MTFCLHVHSGLNNKLVPLLSLLRIARKENRELKCLWGNETLFSFNDLFENLDRVKFITIEEYIDLFNNQNKHIANFPFDTSLSFYIFHTSLQRISPM